MPDDRPAHEPAARTNTDAATIAAEEKLRDAETAQQAAEEAEKLEAVPFERVKKEHQESPSESS